MVDLFSFLVLLDNYDLIRAPLFQDMNKPWLIWEEWVDFVDSLLLIESTYGGYILVFITFISQNNIKLKFNNF